MGEPSKVGFQSYTVGTLGLSSHIQTWKEDKADADQQGLTWAALQCGYHGGKNSVKYVTAGSIIACNNGCAFSRINLPVDHGVETKSTHLPILTVQDYGSQNISSFGECALKRGMQCSKCTPRITSRWTQDTITTHSADAALLQEDAFAVCNTGGMIHIAEVNKTPRSSLKAIFEEQYGFDERTVKIILELHQAIQKKYADESQIKRDWRFTRLLGGFKYGLKEEEGWGDEFQWNQTAGDATIVYQETWGARGYTGVIAQDLPVKKYMTDELGLANDDYEYLKYKVRVQNYLVGKDAKAIKYDEKATLKKTKENISRKEKMSTGLGKTITDTEFIQIWNQQCDDMCGMSDFAHQQITTAAILATAVSEDGALANIYVGGSKEREQMAGWLGDATIYGKNGELPSFGNDDYMADLDAENIGYIVREEEYSYILAIEDYYDRRLLKDNRADLFLEKTDIGRVKQLIDNELFISEYVSKICSTNDIEERKKIEELYKIEDNWMKMLKDRVPDTYNFIRSLEERLPQMEDFQDESI